MKLSRWQAVVILVVNSASPRFRSWFLRFAAKFGKQIGELLGKGYRSIENEVSQALSFVGQEGIFLDVGGNKGGYTAALLSRIPAAQIRIYEPSRRNAEKLEDRFASHPNVQVFGFGLSDENVATVLHSDSPGSSLSSVFKRRLAYRGISFDHTEKIELKRFEEQWRSSLQSAPISLCKIDVEGLELSVLRGMGEALSNTHVIQFEFGGTHIDSKVFFRELWEFFDDSQWAIWRVSPLGPVLIPSYDEGLEHFDGPSNFLAVKKP